MNFSLLARILGIVTLLIGATMLFSLPWAHPALGVRYDIQSAVPEFEFDGFWGLVGSIIICAILGACLLWWGRHAAGNFFRKEALAVVGLSWCLATFLGALPFVLSGTSRSAGVRLGEPGETPRVYRYSLWQWQPWVSKPPLPADQEQVVRQVLASGARGLTADQLPQHVGDAGFDPVARLEQLRASDPDWHDVLLVPGAPGPADRCDHYRVRWVRCNWADALFESQSGFSTTGATVLSDLEDPHLVPHCILFWRSSTHFLGGLGIIVLFVAILGQGSAGKALMRAEMPGPSKESSQVRMQQTAWSFAAIYCALNVLLTLILVVFGLSWFDALCHAFGTMATGGFSTYNASLGHFGSAAIEYVVVVFMVIAGTNFALIHRMLIAGTRSLLADVEWRVYIGLLAVATAVIVLLSWSDDSFANAPDDPVGARVMNTCRYGLFQVVSVMTTTGYGTHDFDRWNHFSRGLLLALMFVGGCAGSTGGGMKVIRHVLLLKILKIEIEQAYHPSVVRPLRVGGKPIDDPELRKNVLVYFSLFLVVFIGSWLLLITLEPDQTWGATTQHKLIDSASAVAATLNNIGPGLGTIGATQNYAHFSNLAKVLFVWLMMLGRVELFAVLVLFFPGFWSTH